MSWRHLNYLNVLAALGDVTEIDPILPHRTMWPEQVRQPFLWFNTTNGFANKLCHFATGNVALQWPSFLLNMLVGATVKVSMVTVTIPALLCHPRACTIKLFTAVI
jgi:hypothetical protein